MVGIAFDLRRPSLVIADQDRRSNSKKRDRSRKEQRLTRNMIFRLIDVRNDLLRRLKNTAAHARKRKRRAHQLDERAALERIVPTLRLLRKLTRDEFTKLRRVSQLFKTAPILLPGARRVSILQRQDVVAHEFEVYVTIAIAHFRTSNSLSMTSRTTRQNLFTLDLVFRFPTDALFQFGGVLVFGPPRHVEDPFLRSQEPFRIAMTLQTPLHL